ncbi:MAG: hypothetical protein Q7T19_00995 [Caulobacter sp.]|nr:hypothetical protein [Caulobacter sp.]
MAPPSPADAARMLAEVNAARTEMARRAVAPVWYHPALGLLIGGLVAVQGQPLWILGPYYLVFVLGLAGLARVYRARTGMWVNGYRKGRTMIVSLGLAALFVAIMIGSTWLVRAHGLTVAPFVAGVLAALVTTAGGFLWEIAYRRDLRDGAHV